MENYAMIITKQDINYTGQIYEGFVEEGILIKPSKKTDMYVWIPLEEISQIVFPNAEILEAEKIDMLFHKLNEIKTRYGVLDNSAAK